MSTPTKQQIHRQQVEAGVEFRAPRTLTFGWQEERKAFSVWWVAGVVPTDTYIVVGTGHEFSAGWGWQHVATVVLPDGFHAFHLVRVKMGGPV